MSFGAFESLAVSENEKRISRQASVNKLSAAVYDVKRELGGFLFGASSMEEFRDRVAMVKNDQSVYRVIQASGLHPATGVVRRIVGKNSILEREFKAKLAAEHEDDRPDQISEITYKPVEGQPTFKPKADFKRYRDEMTSSPSRDNIKKRDFSGPVKGDSGTHEFNGNPQQSDFAPNNNRDFGKAARRRKAAPGEVGPVRPDVPITNVDVPGHVTQNVQSFDEQPDQKIAMAAALYGDWCQFNGRDPRKLASLDVYGSNLSDSMYFKLAAVIEEWEFTHKPKTHSTEQPKKQKLGGSQRTAAPNHLQKADEALTNLLNEKAEEFQKSVQALQQALLTVQQAEQAEQQMSPLNVMPPAGTINPLPGQADSAPLPLGPGAGQIPGGAPAPAGGGAPAPAPAPLPPPADGGAAGATPDGGADPSQPPLQATARRRRRNVQRQASDWEGPGKYKHRTDPDRKHLTKEEVHTAYPDDDFGYDKPGQDYKQSRRRQADVFSDWENWQNQRGQQGQLGDGSERDYEQFANEKHKGPRAVNKLKNKHFEHRPQQMEGRRRPK